MCVNMHCIEKGVHVIVALKIYPPASGKVCTRVQSLLASATVTREAARSPLKEHFILDVFVRLSSPRTNSKSLCLTSTTQRTVHSSHTPHAPFRAEAASGCVLWMSDCAYEFYSPQRCI